MEANVRTLLKINNRKERSEAPRGKPRGICGDSPLRSALAQQGAKRNCAEALADLGQVNPASPVGLRRDRLAIHPCGKPQGIPWPSSGRLAKANKHMPKGLRNLFLTGLILPAGFLGFSFGKVKLAQNGKTKYVIIQGQSPTKAEEFAAKELRAYLGKVTGAKFAIVNETNLTGEVKGIYIGQTEFASKHGVDVSKLDREEWIIRSVGKNLVLTGGRPAGTLYAVYEFLEKNVGCHWLDRDTEVIPRYSDLTIAKLKIKANPAFWQRFISPGLWYMETSGEMIEKEGLLLARNKSTGWPATFGQVNYGSPGGCHTFYAYSKDFPTNHPEYFSMDKDGKRERAKDGGGPGQLCLTNPDVRKLMLAQLKKFIAKDRENAAKAGRPAPWVYDISQNDDHRPICLCPTCRAFAEKDGGRVIVLNNELADSSGLLIDFINELADGIWDEYPDVLIMTFAYSQTLKPPKTLKPRDNVIIRLAQLNSEWAYAPKGSEKAAHFPDYFRPMSHPVNRGALEDLTGWSKISKHLAVWDYWILYSPNDKFPTPYVNVACLQPDLQLFLNNHVEDVYVECENPNTTSFSALKLWLGQKLLQDPNQPAEPLLQTFMAGYYGAAAPKMREYLDYMEKRIAVVPATEGKISSMREHLRPYLDLEFFKTARGLLTEAEQACGPDTNALFHVRHEWIPVDAAINNMWLQLKGQLPSGETMPFDRQTIVKQYCDTRLAQMERFYYGKIPDKIKNGLEKEFSKYRKMPDIEEQIRQPPPELKVPVLSKTGANSTKKNESKASYSATLYVWTNSPSPIPPYTNWNSAATNIQDAINAAGINDLVLVTNGVYRFTTPVTNFFSDYSGYISGSHTNVALIMITNRITVQSVNGPANTIIDGSRPGNPRDSRCVFLAHDAVLNGFTIRNGNNINGPDHWLVRGGGGVRIHDGGMIFNCIITGNKATHGGGIMIDCGTGGVRDGSIYNCVISNNEAGAAGGGMYLHSTKGTVSESIICDNVSTGAQGDAGGIMLSGSPASPVTNCIITRNIARDGGGIQCRGGGTVINCYILTNRTINGNNAPGYCTISGDTATNNILLNNFIFGNTSIPEGAPQILIP